MAVSESLTTPTPMVAEGGDHVVKIVNLPEGASGITDGIDLRRARLCRIVLPYTGGAGWVAANITFQTSYDGVNWANLYDALGSEYTVTVGAITADRSVIIPFADFVGVRYLKIRSGTAAAPVNQTNAPNIVLVCVR